MGRRSLNQLFSHEISQIEADMPTSCKTHHAYIMGWDVWMEANPKIPLFLFVEGQWRLNPAGQTLVSTKLVDACVARFNIALPQEEDEKHKPLDTNRRQNPHGGAGANAIPTSNTTHHHSAPKGNPDRAAKWVRVELLNENKQPIRPNIPNSTLGLIFRENFIQRSC